MANVVRSTPIVLIEVVLVGGESSGSVAVDGIQSVVPEQRQPRAGTDVAIHDQLVLSENALGGVLVDILQRAERPGVRISRIRQGRDGSVNVAGQKLVEPAGV